MLIPYCINTWMVYFYYYYFALFCIYFSILKLNLAQPFLWPPVSCLVFLVGMGGSVGFSVNNYVLPIDK